MPTYPTYKLGDICELLNGFAFKSSNYVQSGLRVIRITNVKKGYVIDEEPQFYPLETQEELKKYILKKGDLLISLTGNVGRVGILREDLLPAALNQRVGCLRVKDKSLVSLQYLFHLLNTNSFEKDCINSSKGIAQKNMSTEWLKEYEINLPPLPTQQAIVARIEALFAELDKAAEHLRTAQQQLKTYRQAVLNHWLNNDEGKWETVKLGEVADVNTGSTPKRGNKEYWENGTIPWITSGETNNQYITKATEFITTKAVAETNCKIIAKGSLVIAMYGEGKTRGKCAELSIDATTNQALASITFTDSRMYKNFAKWFFEKNYEDMRMLSSGGVQPNLNLGIIKNMILPLPPLTDQHRIVQEIESRLSQAEAAEASIAEALQKTEALRQSILKKAFSGELV